MLHKNIVTDEEGREIPIQILDSLPIGLMLSKFNKENYTMVDYHWHKEFQFSLITKGSFLYQVADVEYELSAGDGIFINANQIHKTVALEDASSYIFIYFHPDILSSDRDSYINRNYIVPLLINDRIGSYKITADSDYGLLNLIREAYEINKTQEDYFELDLISIVFKIWKAHFMILKNIDANAIIPDPVINEKLRTIIDYISHNYKDNITLEDIASSVNLSKSECSRFFKKNFKQNLFEYILQYRINKSVDLIINSDLPITEIAYQCGFNSQSYFISKFRKLKNITPLQMRKDFKLSREKYIDTYGKEK